MQIGSETKLDANGNLLFVKEGTANRNYKYFANTNLLKNTDGSTGIVYSHGKNGNIISAPYPHQSGITYDPYFNLTTGLSFEDMESKYWYGADNERVLKRNLIDPVTSNYEYIYYYRGLNDYPLVEKKYNNSTLQSTKLYIYGPTGLVAIKDGSQNFFVIKDHLGSTRAVVNSNGSKLAKYHYSPYGKMMYAWVNTDVTYKFTGQERDDEFGLYNFRARLYDAELGMFYAYDPAAQGFSPFGYAGNNPVIYIDKDGRLFGIDDLIIIGALAVGYLAGAGENHWEMNPLKWDWKSADTYEGLLFGLAMGAVGGAVAVGANLGIGATFFSGLSEPIASFSITLGNLATPAMYVSSAVIGVGGISLLGYYGETQTWNKTDRERNQLSQNEVGDDKKQKTIDKNGIYLIGGYATTIGSLLSFPFQYEVNNSLKGLNGLSTDILAPTMTYSKWLTRFGTGMFALGTAFSIGQFRENPTFEQGFKSFADIGFGFAMNYGGIPGFTVGAIYFGLDYVIGWDEITRQYLKSYNRALPYRPGYIHYFR